MKLVQVYNTKEGNEYNCGYPSFRSMIASWNKSLLVHKENYDIVIYTDQQGYDKISNLLDEAVTYEIIEFENIDDRYYNIGKLQAHLHQTEPYLMIDIDATLSDVITEIDTDIIVENVRPGPYGRYLHTYDLKPINIKKIPGIPCSGLLGFSDPSFAKRYAQSALDRIKASDEEAVVFDCLWAVEEILLANYIADEDMTYRTFEKYEHLQGTNKK